MVMSRRETQDPSLVPSLLTLPLQELRGTHQAALLGEIRALHPQHRAPGQPSDDLPLPGEREG